MLVHCRVMYCVGSYKWKFGGRERGRRREEKGGHLQNTGGLVGKTSSTRRLVEGNKGEEGRTFITRILVEKTSTTRSLVEVSRVFRFTTTSRRPSLPSTKLPVLELFPSCFVPLIHLSSNTRSPSFLHSLSLLPLHAAHMKRMGLRSRASAIVFPSTYDTMTCSLPTSRSQVLNHNQVLVHDIHVSTQIYKYPTK